MSYGPQMNPLYIFFLHSKKSPRFPAAIVRRICAMGGRAHLSVAFLPPADVSPDTLFIFYGFPARIPLLSSFDEIKSCEHEIFMCVHFLALAAGTCAPRFGVTHSVPFRDLRLRDKGESWKEDSNFESSVSLFFCLSRRNRTHTFTHNFDPWAIERRRRMSEKSWLSKVGLISKLSWICFHSCDVNLGPK